MCSSNWASYLPGTQLKLNLWNLIESLVSRVLRLCCFVHDWTSRTEEITFYLAVSHQIKWLIGTGNELGNRKGLYTFFFKYEIVDEFLSSSTQENDSWFGQLVATFGTAAKSIQNCNLMLSGKKKLQTDLGIICPKKNLKLKKKKQKEEEFLWFKNILS